MGDDVPSRLFTSTPSLTLPDSIKPILEQGKSKMELNLQSWQNSNNNNKTKDLLEETWFESPCDMKTFHEQERVHAPDVTTNASSNTAQFLVSVSRHTEVRRDCVCFQQDLTRFGFSLKRVRSTSIEEASDSGRKDSSASASPSSPPRCWRTWKKHTREKVKKMKRGGKTTRKSSGKKTTGGFHAV